MHAATPEARRASGSGAAGAGARTRVGSRLLGLQPPVARRPRGRVGGEPAGRAPAGRRRARRRLARAAAGLGARQPRLVAGGCVCRVFHVLPVDKDVTSAGQERGPTRSGAAARSAKPCGMWMKLRATLICTQAPAGCSGRRNASPARKIAIRLHGAHRCACTRHKRTNTLLCLSPVKTRRTASLRPPSLNFELRPPTAATPQALDAARLLALGPSQVGDARVTPCWRAAGSDLHRAPAPDAYAPTLRTAHTTPLAARSTRSTRRPRSSTSIGSTSSTSTPARPRRARSRDGRPRRRCRRRRAVAAAAARARGHAAAGLLHLLCLAVAVRLHHHHQHAARGRRRRGRGRRRRTADAEREAAKGRRWRRGGCVIPARARRAPRRPPPPPAPPAASVSRHPPARARRTTRPLPHASPQTCCPATPSC